MVIASLAKLSCLDKVTKFAMKVDRSGRQLRKLKQVALRREL